MKDFSFYPFYNKNYFPINMEECSKYILENAQSLFTVSDSFILLHNPLNYISHPPSIIYSDKNDEEYIKKAVSLVFSLTTSLTYVKALYFYNNDGWRFLDNLLSNPDKLIKLMVDNQRNKEEALFFSTWKAKNGDASPPPFKSSFKSSISPQDITRNKSELLKLIHSQLVPHHLHITIYNMHKKIVKFLPILLENNLLKRRKRMRNALELEIRGYHSYIYHSGDNDNNKELQLNCLLKNSFYLDRSLFSYSWLSYIIDAVLNKDNIKNTNNPSSSSLSSLSQIWDPQCMTLNSIYNYFTVLQKNISRMLEDIITNSNTHDALSETLIFDRNQIVKEWEKKKAVLDNVMGIKDKANKSSYESFKIQKVQFNDAVESIVPYVLTPARKGTNHSFKIYCQSIITACQPKSLLPDNLKIIKSISPLFNISSLESTVDFDKLPDKQYNSIQCHSSPFSDSSKRVDIKKNVNDNCILMLNEAFKVLYELDGMIKEQLYFEYNYSLLIQTYEYLKSYIIEDSSLNNDITSEKNKLNNEDEKVKNKDDKENVNDKENEKEKKEIVAKKNISLNSMSSFIDNELLWCLFYQLINNKKIFGKENLISGKRIAENYIERCKLLLLEINSENISKNLDSYFEERRLINSLRSIFTSRFENFEVISEDYGVSNKISPQQINNYFEDFSRLIKSELLENKNNNSNLTNEKVEAKEEEIKKKIDILLSDNLTAERTLLNSSVEHINIPVFNKVNLLFKKYSMKSLCLFAKYITAEMIHGLPPFVLIYKTNQISFDNLEYRKISSLNVVHFKPAEITSTAHRVSYALNNISNGIFNFDCPKYSAIKEIYSNREDMLTKHPFIIIPSLSRRFPSYNPSEQEDKFIKSVSLNDNPDIKKIWKELSFSTLEPISRNMLFRRIELYKEILIDIVVRSPQIIMKAIAEEAVMEGLGIQTDYKYCSRFLFAGNVSSYAKEDKESKSNVSSSLSVDNFELPLMNISYLPFHTKYFIPVTLPQQTPPCVFRSVYKVTKEKDYDYIKKNFNYDNNSNVQKSFSEKVSSSSLISNLENNKHSLSSDDVKLTNCFDREDIYCNFVMKNVFREDWIHSSHINHIYAIISLFQSYLLSPVAYFENIAHQLLTIWDDTFPILSSLALLSTNQVNKTNDNISKESSEKLKVRKIIANIAKESTFDVNSVACLINALEFVSLLIKYLCKEDESHPNNQVIYPLLRKTYPLIPVLQFIFKAWSLFKPLSSSDLSSKSDSTVDFVNLMNQTHYSHLIIPDNIKKSDFSLINNESFAEKVSSVITNLEKSVNNIISLFEKSKIYYPFERINLDLSLS